MSISTHRKPRYAVLESVTLASAVMGGTLDSERQMDRLHGGDNRRSGDVRGLGSDDAEDVFCAPEKALTRLASRASRPPGHA